MTYADLPACIDITCDAFQDDAYISWLSPKSDIYPDSARAAWHRRTRARLSQQGFYNFVCVMDKNDVSANAMEDNGPEDTRAMPSGEIMGYVMFARNGPPDDELQRSWHSNNSSLLKSIERFTCTVEAKYFEALRLEYARDYTHAAEQAAFVASSDAFAGLPSHWHAHMLAVSPRWQRRGVASMLLQWGFDRAREELVPLTLRASATGLALYRKLGFRVVSWSVIESISQNEGGAVCVWDEKDVWVREAVGGEREAMYFSRMRYNDGTWTEKAKEYMRAQDRKGRNL